MTTGSLAPRRFYDRSVDLDPRVADLGAFELLLSAIELGSLSQAAARHTLAQPSVSGRIRRLEGALGLSLLHRDPTGVRPTSAGRAVAAWAEDLLARAQELADGVAALRSNA